MDVSVIIVNYNTLKMTSECIESVIKYTEGISYEIILVDNASKDGSREYFEKDSRIKYVYSEKNLGFGRANNLGYSIATGDFIFFLNSDTLLIDNSIAHFYNVASQRCQLACYGGTLIDREGEHIHSFGKFPSLRGFIKQYCNSYLTLLSKKDKFPVLNEDTIIPVDYITGADLFIPRWLIEKYGLFNEAFFMYYEETELQKRYSLNGYHSYLIPSINIIHLEGKSFSGKSLIRLQRVLKGSMIYSKLCFSRWEYILFRICTLLLNIPKILIYPGKIKERIQTFAVLLIRSDK